MYKVVLLRHGESTWNMENRFIGWTDVDLSQRGTHYYLAEPTEIRKAEQAAVGQVRAQ